MIRDAMRRLTTSAIAVALGALLVAGALASAGGAADTGEPTRELQSVELQLFRYGHKEETLLTACDGSEYWPAGHRMRAQVIGTLDHSATGAPSEHWSAEIEFQVSNPAKRHQMDLQWWSQWHHQNTRPGQLSRILFQSSHNKFGDFGKRFWEVRVKVTTDSSAQTFTASCRFKVDPDVL